MATRISLKVRKKIEQYIRGQHDAGQTDVAFLVRVPKLFLVNVLFSEYLTHTINKEFRLSLSVNMSTFLRII